MKKSKINLAVILSLVSIAFVAISCVNGKHDDQSENNQNKGASVTKTNFPYNLEKPVQYNMPHNLFEISGIVFHNGDPKEVYAIQDEDGDLFHLGLTDKESKFSKFGAKGDYEDLAIINNYFVVLKSNGELHTFPLSGINTAEVANVVKTKDLVPKAEYEGLAADAKNNMLYILTKDSKPDSKAKASSIYGFKCAADGSLTPNGTFSLSHKEIEKISGSDKFRFRPSAFTLNTLTNEWYVVSSINKLLVVTDKDFKVKATYPLNPSIFNQPEGIAFDRDNNLYISNEGGTLAAGNILMFKFNKP